MNNNEKFTIGERSFYAISQIGAPSPFTAVNHVATNGRWINFAVRARIGVDFQRRKHAVLEANFAAVNSERQFLPNVHRCAPQSRFPATEIESAQLITTTVVSRCLCLHFADWRSNFPDCRRDDKPIPSWTNCAPVDRGRRFNMIRYVTGDSDDNLQSNAERERKFNLSVLDHRRWPYRAALQYADICQWDGEMKSKRKVTLKRLRHFLMRLMQSGFRVTICHF